VETETQRHQPGPVTDATTGAYTAHVS